MTKTFCDICGKPADPDLHGRRFDVSMGVNLVIGFGVDGAFYRRSPGSHDARTGRPDLCPACVAANLRKLADAIHP